MVEYDCKVKTLISDSPEGIDKLHNKFKEEHKVRFTQSHVVERKDGSITFALVEYYE